MSEVKMKEWNMRTETRKIVSEAYNLCKEMSEEYGQTVSVRQIYYHLFSKGLIELTQSEYHRVVQFMVKARKRGYIPFGWIEDRSRTPLWKMLYPDLERFLWLSKDGYSKDTWMNQDNFVLILVEKEALAPIIWDIAEKYNVFVFPTKGFSSWSMFVEDIRTAVYRFGEKKHLVVLVLSDLDPSGGHISKDYVNKFQYMSSELDFEMPEVVEIAVTEEQVKKHKLPSRQKDYRNKGIIDIWELDALNPKLLRTIVEDAIVKHLDLEQLNKDLETERKEREHLELLIEFGIRSYLDESND